MLTPQAQRTTSSWPMTHLVRSATSSNGTCPLSVSHGHHDLPFGKLAALMRKKYVPSRRTQAGYASGSGTMTVFFTDSDTVLGQRMLDNVMPVLKTVRESVCSGKRLRRCSQHAST